MSIFFSTELKRQPQTRPVIDSSSPLAQGLVFAVIGTPSLGFVDLVSGKLPSVSGASYSLDIGGYAAKPASPGGLIKWPVGTTGLDKLTSSGTLLMCMRSNNNNETIQAFGSRDDVVTGAGVFLLYDDKVQVLNGFLAGANNDNYRATSNPNALGANSEQSFHTFGFSWDGAGVQTYADGKPNKLTTGGKAAFSADANAGRFTRLRSGTAQSEFLWAYAWNRVLTPAEVLSLQDNPWQIFKIGGKIAVASVLGATVQSDATIRYDLIASSTKDILAEWNLLSTTLNDVTTRWNSLTSINTDSTVRWNALSSTAQDALIEWHLQTSATNDTALEWNLVTSLFKDTVIEYDLRTSISRDAILEWSNLSSITKDTILEWNSLASANSDKAIEWNALSSTNRDTTLEWDLLSAALIATSDIPLRWNLISSIYKDITQEWNVLTGVQLDESVRWNIASAISQDLVTHYNLNSSTSNDITIHWDSAGIVNGDLVVRYNLTSTASAVNLFRVVVIRQADSLIKVANSPRTIII